MCVSGNSDIQWCFSQVKGTLDDDVTEGEFLSSDHHDQLEGFTFFFYMHFSILLTFYLANIAYLSIFDETGYEFLSTDDHDRLALGSFSNILSTPFNQSRAHTPTERFLLEMYRSFQKISVLPQFYLVNVANFAIFICHHQLRALPLLHYFWNEVILITYHNYFVHLFGGHHLYSGHS